MLTRPRLKSAGALFLPRENICASQFIKTLRIFYNMEFTFSALKQKDVINLIDGKHLGRVCDITFSFPENNVLGFTVTGCKGFRFSKQEVFLPVKCVVKIGADAVLVKFGKEEKPDDCHPPKPDCRPDFCCPPPENRPPRGFPNDGSSRRDYGEYE